MLNVNNISNSIHFSLHSELLVNYCYQCIKFMKKSHILRKTKHVTNAVDKGFCHFYNTLPLLAVSVLNPCLVILNFTCSFKLLFIDQLFLTFSLKSWHYNDGRIISPLKSLHIGWPHHYIGFTVRNYRFCNALGCLRPKMLIFI